MHCFCLFCLFSQLTCIIHCPHTLNPQGGGDRQFNGLVDVYRKTMATDGVAGLYRGFTISCVGIIVYRGLYFGMYDSIKPVLLTGNLAVSYCFYIF
jgi:hypothetical protein